MTWIRFDPDEGPVELPVLYDVDGDTVRLQAQRGRAALVLLLCPDGDGSGCALAMSQLGRQIDAIIAEDAFAFAVFPDELGNRAPATPLPLLVDRNGGCRRALAGLLEFDTNAQPLLFVLDDGGRPVAAWLGRAEPGADLGREALERLQRAALRCPE